MLPPACRPQAAPLTLTLRVSPSPAPARPCGTPAVPLPGQHNARQDCVGQERTPRLLTSLLPELPSCPAPAAATPGPLRPRQTPAPPLLAPAARAVCSPTARPRAGPRSPAAPPASSVPRAPTSASHRLRPQTPGSRTRPPSAPSLGLTATQTQPHLRPSPLPAQFPPQLRGRRGLAWGGREPGQTQGASDHRHGRGLPSWERPGCVLGPPPCAQAGRLPHGSVVCQNRKRQGTSQWEPHRRSRPPLTQQPLRGRRDVPWVSDRPRERAVLTVLSWAGHAGLLGAARENCGEKGRMSAPSHLSRARSLLMGGRRPVHRATCPGPAAGRRSARHTHGTKGPRQDSGAEPATGAQGAGAGGAGRAPACCVGL